MIKDSGNRTEFESGAVRDIQEGKGRCDLLPLDVVCRIYSDSGKKDEAEIFWAIRLFMNDGQHKHLLAALDAFLELHPDWGFCVETMLLEVSIHFEEGAKKYGERNWEKGIPTERYINSALRHLLKCMRGDDDEPHDRAFCWNLMCCIWTCMNHPEQNSYPIKQEGVDAFGREKEQ